MKQNNQTNKKETKTKTKCEQEIRYKVELVVVGEPFSKILYIEAQLISCLIYIHMVANHA